MLNKDSNSDYSEAYEEFLKNNTPAIPEEKPWNRTPKGKPQARNIILTFNSLREKSKAILAKNSSSK